MPHPTVSVVVVNWNGRHLLETCLASVEGLAYPRERVDVIVFDNASTDGSRAWLREAWPRVRCLESGTNLGFADASTRAATAATGEVVAFLNNDVRVDPQWLMRMVEARTATGAAALGSRILDWEGRRFDFDGAAMNFHGHGTNRRYGQPYRDAADGRTDGGSGRSDHNGADGVRSTLFACGAAMIADRATFLACGGFDADYFAYFEDVDLGWRLWVEGETVVHVPGAVAYHRHHGSGLPADHRTRLLERNALATIVKNYDDTHLDVVLPAALVLVEARACAAGEEQAGVYADAVAGFRAALPALRTKRAAVQARRRRADRDILPLFVEPFRPSCFGRTYWREQQRLVRALGIASMFDEETSKGAERMEDFIADLQERIATLEGELAAVRQAATASAATHAEERARLEGEIARVEREVEAARASRIARWWRSARGR